MNATILDTTEPTTLDDAWLPNAPAHIPAKAVALDCHLYSRAKCGNCKRRGLKTRAEHTRQGKYRVVGKCMACDAEETF